VRGVRDLLLDRFVEQIGDQRLELVLGVRGGDRDQRFPVDLDPAQPRLVVEESGDRPRVRPEVEGVEERTDVATVTPSCTAVDNSSSTS